MEMCINVAVGAGLGGGFNWTHIHKIQRGNSEKWKKKLVWRNWEWTQQNGERKSLESSWQKWGSKRKFNHNLNLGNEEVVKWQVKRRKWQRAMRSTLASTLTLRMWHPQWWIRPLQECDGNQLDWKVDHVGGLHEGWSLERWVWKQRMNFDESARGNETSLLVNVNISVSQTNVQT